MSFLLPGIYKPFYIEGLMVRINKTTFFSLIDIHNGIGVYDNTMELYNIGNVKCIFNVTGTANEVWAINSNVYRETPLFVSTYQGSITSIFKKYSSFTTGTLKSIEVLYTPPSYIYDNTDNKSFMLNREIDIKMKIDLEDSSRPYAKLYEKYNNDAYDAAFCLEQNNSRKTEFNIYHGALTNNGNYLSPDERFIEYVNSVENIVYYVVNESFYKYFIDPKVFGEYSSKLYRTYNNGEIPNFSFGRSSGKDDEDVTRVFYDLFPHKLRYSNGYFPNEGNYETDKQCCLTAPFFRMFPQINSYDPSYPMCIKIKMNANKDNIELDKPILTETVEGDLSSVNFYLIGVKSPLTFFKTNVYTDALSGKQLKPEQDYITFIENYGRLKIVAVDNMGVTKIY